MNLIRKLVGHMVVAVVFVALVLSLLWGWITLTDISTALAFTLVGAIAAVFYWTWRPEINRWFSERNQPNLDITITEVVPQEEVERVELWLRNGQKRTHEARFCFITITNSGKADAKGVGLFCGHHMLLMPYKGKKIYRVDGYWHRPEEFEDYERSAGIEAWVIATLDGVKQNKTVSIPRGHSERFGLFFTLKDLAPLCVPGFTRNYYHAEGSPPKVNLHVIVRHDDAQGYYMADFEVTMRDWANPKPRLVKTEFHPFSPGFKQRRWTELYLD